MTRKRPWTDAESITLRELHDAGLSQAEIVTKMRRDKGAVGRHATALGITLRRRALHRFTPAEVARLRAEYPDTPTIKLAKSMGRTLQTIYAAAKRHGLAKSAEYLASPHACRLRRGDNVGKQTRFQKGQVPANKGLRRPGWAPGRMASTQFKKGHVSNNVLPIGTELVNPDGYLVRKVSETKVQRIDWVPVHRLLWIEHNGAIPAGHVVIFKDSNKANVVIENLELLSRRDNMLRNTVHNLPQDLVQVIMLKGALKRQINRRAEQS